MHFHRMQRPFMHRCFLGRDSLEEPPSYAKGSSTNLRRSSGNRFKPKSMSLIYRAILVQHWE
ncbi:MAG: hypothetical protein ACK55Z_10050, partial [bacterium]